MFIPRKIIREDLNNYMHNGTLPRSCVLPCPSSGSEGGMASPFIRILRVLLFCVLFFCMTISLREYFYFLTEILHG